MRFVGKRMGASSFFLVIEGLDGAGKSGMARQLHATLSQTHKGGVVLTYEPHDPSAAGLFIRNALTKRTKVPDPTLALAFALNRNDHLTHVINPALSADNEKQIVICDRYLLSSLVYQSTNDLSMDDILWYNRHARTPDLTIYLNVSYRNAYNRLPSRRTDRDLFEKNLAKRAQKYQKAIELLRSKDETIVEVDANPDFATVFADVLRALKYHGPTWLRIQPPLLLDEDDADDTRALDHASDSEINLVTELRSVGPHAFTGSEIASLFRAYLVSHGFDWGVRIPWLKTPSYELTLRHKSGLESNGIALLPDRRSQNDGITKLIQKLSDSLDSHDVIPHTYDFIVVLDRSEFEQTTRYERDKGENGKTSPPVLILTQKDLHLWLEHEARRAPETIQPALDIQTNVL